MDFPLGCEVLPKDTIDNQTLRGLPGLHRSPARKGPPDLAHGRGIRTKEVLDEMKRIDPPMAYLSTCGERRSRRRSGT